VTVATSFEVEILLPDGELGELTSGDTFSGQAFEIIFPGLDGMIGIRAGHAPMLAGLDVGDMLIVEYRDGVTRDLHFATGSGLVEVESGGKVSIFTSAAEYAGSIDIERAESALERAEKRLAHKDGSLDLRRAEIALQRALNRLEIAKKYGGR
jgi:F-type H+-transporting ATPase subunit epsilon